MKTNKYLRVISILMVCLMVFCSNAWGVKVLSFDFSDDDLDELSEWPTSATTATTKTYELTNTYTFALGANVYMNSDYLMLKYTTSLGLPAISGYKLTKVEITNSSGCSTKTNVGISSSSSSASYITGGSTQTYTSRSTTYTYNLTSTSAETVYYIYVTSANCQIVDLTLTYTATSKFKVTFEGGTGTPASSSLTESSIGAGVTLPSASPSAGCASDYEFMGWAPEEIDETDEEPTLYFAGNKFYPESDCKLYAVYVADKAATTYYKLISNRAQLKSGENYIIEAYSGSNDYAIKAAVKGTNYIDCKNITSAISSNVYHEATADNSIVWTITKSAESTVQLYNSSTSKYLRINSSSPYYLQINASSSSFTLEWELHGEGYVNTFAFKSSSKYPYYDSSNGRFGSQSSSNWNLFLYKRTYSGTFNTNPSCATCDDDPTIGAALLNGTFSLSSVGVRCPTSGTAVQDNCEWEDYGFVWGTNNTGTRPDLTSDASNKVQTGTSGTGNTWDDDLESTFTTGITYYYRAYGENGHGLAYGDVASFTPYKVYYNANGGSGSIDDQIVNTGGSVTLSDGTGFSKDGYHITKWALGSASGTQSDPSSSSGSVTANKEYYAIWTANTYTVTFDKNGGSGDAMSGQAFTYGTAQNLSANTYAAPAHKYFLGWNTDKDATTALYEDGESVNNLTTTNNETVTLYAIWKEHTYTNYRTNCCTKPTISISGTGKTVTDDKISFPVLREDLEGAASSTWTELQITISSNSSGAITIIEGTGGDAGKTAWKLSSWESRNADGGTIATTDHATFTNPSSGNYLFKVKTTTGYTGQGTYRIGIQQAANGDYCAATVYLWVDVTLRDKFVDAVNGNGTINRDGHGAQLATPTLSELDTQDEDACHSEGRKLKGWIKETDLKAQYETGSSTRVQTVDGLCETCADGTDQTSLIVTPGTNVTMSGATWYAVWAYEK